MQGSAWQTRSRMSSAATAVTTKTDKTAKTACTINVHSAGDTAGYVAYGRAQIQQAAGPVTHQALPEDQGAASCLGTGKSRKREG